ncbi:MAG: hypothetical protein K2Y27_03845 [Xanthobacteraceae bacterium]|nr:hypothetical protein [Xanthobacteraceae bacterium]
MSSAREGKFARLIAVVALAAGLVLPALSRPAPAQEAAEAAPAAPGAKPANGGYYIEFRVGQIGTYGHSYAVYGAQGGKANYADLHPMGGYAGMAVGHVLPVPGNTRWDPGVLALPVTARYRKALNGDQYRRLLAAVKTAKSGDRYWNAVTNNCNHFIGQLAQAVGLKVPGQFQVAYSFVPALKELNEGGGTPRAAGPAKRRVSSAPQT